MSLKKLYHSLENDRQCIKFIEEGDWQQLSIDGTSERVIITKSLLDDETKVAYVGDSTYRAKDTFKKLSLPKHFRNDLNIGVKVFYAFNSKLPKLLDDQEIYMEQKIVTRKEQGLAFVLKKLF